MTTTQSTETRSDWKPKMKTTKTEGLGLYCPRCTHEMIVSLTVPDKPMSSLLHQAKCTLCDTLWVLEEHHG